MSPMWSDVRAGMRAVAPMLVGIVPFGLVAGASPVTRGLGGWAAVGFSTIVFAGASQLAAIDVLGDGGSVLVAVVAACTINLRMLLYAASLAPHLAQERLGRRLAAAYVLTDQAYAVSIARWGNGDPPERRLPFYFGAGLTLWSSWQLATLAGVALGNGVPDDLPLDFAVPLVFLVLLVPTLVTRPAIAAAAAGGGAAVLTAELGGGDLSILTGAIAGIAAGAVCEVVLDRRGKPPVLEAGT
jgi:predicted branched-subunit amino acid permease